MHVFELVLGIAGGICSLGAILRVVVHAARAVQLLLSIDGRLRTLGQELTAIRRDNWSLHERVDRLEKRRSS